MRKIVFACIAAFAFSLNTHAEPVAKELTEQIIKAITEGSEAAKP